MSSGDAVRTQTGWVPPPGLIAEFEALLDEPGIKAVVGNGDRTRSV